MKKTLYIFAALSLSVAFLVPAFAKADLAPAAAPSSANSTNFNVDNTGSTFQVDNTAAKSAAAAPLPTLPNPLGDKVSTIPQLIYKVVQALVDVSYVIIAFFLILSGFKFVMAQGSEDKLTGAKNTFFNTIIGAVIIIGAQVIVSVAQSIFASLK